MSIPLRRSVLFLAIFISLCATSRAETVSVYNRLGVGYGLTIHCRSKDDDLGVHVIAYSEDFSFSFHSNFFNTLFYCELQWQQTSYTFDAYDYGRDYRRCEFECYWEVKQDSLLGYNDAGVNDITYAFK